MAGRVVDYSRLPPDSASHLSFLSQLKVTARFWISAKFEYIIKIFLKNNLNFSRSTIFCAKVTFISYNFV